MTSGYSVSTGVGRAVASTIDTLWTPRDPLPGKRGVVLCHGAGWAGQFAGMVLTTPSAFLLAAQLAQTGFYCAAVNEANGWGNDALDVAAVAGARTMLVNAGCATDKVMLLGISMGFATAWAYARENPTKVSAMVGIEPLCSINDIWANQAAYRTEIGAAWDVSYPTALPSAAEQSNSASTIAGACSVQAYYSSGDTLVRPATITALRDAVLAANGDMTATVVGSSDHGDAPIAATPFSTVAQFLAANIA